MRKKDIGFEFLNSDDAGFIRDDEDGDSYKGSDGSGYYHGADGSEGYIYSDGVLEVGITNQVFSRLEIMLRKHDFRPFLCRDTILILYCTT